MTKLPISAFPIAGKATQSSGFVIAILIGLAIYILERKKQDIAAKK